MGGPQPPTPHHLPLNAARKPENAAAGGGGVMGGCRDGVPGIWLTIGENDVLQAPGANPHRNGL